MGASASARILCATCFMLALVGPANGATTPLYAGGVTLSGKVYRNIFNSFGVTAQGDLCQGLAICPGSHYRSDVEILYLSVTSSNTAKAFQGNNPALFVSGNKIPENPPVASTRDFGPYYGTGTGANWRPSGSPTNYFPKISFASGDPMTSSDVSKATALGFGPPLQVPSLIYSVVMTVSPQTVWTPKNPVPVGGGSGVNISTDAFCGIFTGALTDWSDPEFKPANRNVTLGKGPITVVYRHDGAATTLLLANALLNQCGTTSNPVSKHPVPDQWLADNGIANRPPYLATTSFFFNVYTAKHLPANFFNNSGFSGVDGGVVTITGMQEAVDATPGAVGYLSTDYAQPIQTGNDRLGNPIAAGANLQTYASFSKPGTTPLYVPPSSAHTLAIMQTLRPPSFVAGATLPASDPLSWSVMNPTPAATSAYPIGGFAYFELYSCYASAIDVDALVGTKAGKLGLMRWYFGSTTENQNIPSTMLTKAAFAPVPVAWTNAARILLTSNQTTRIGTPGQAKTACAGVMKGA